MKLILQGERATGYGVALLCALFGELTNAPMLKSVSPNAMNWCEKGGNQKSLQFFFLWERVDVMAMMMVTTTWWHWDVEAEIVYEMDKLWYWMLFLSAPVYSNTNTCNFEIFPHIFFT